MPRVITDTATVVPPRAYPTSPTQGRSHKARHFEATDRHAIVDPKTEPEKWARNITLSRVSDLFRTRAGLAGHVTAIQDEVNRARVSRLDGMDGEMVVRIIAAMKSVAQALEKAKKSAPFELAGSLAITFELLRDTVII